MSTQFSCNNNDSVLINWNAAMLITVDAGISTYHFTASFSTLLYIPLHSCHLVTLIQKLQIKQVTTIWIPTATNARLWICTSAICTQKTWLQYCFMFVLAVLIMIAQNTHHLVEENCIKIALLMVTKGQDDEDWTVSWSSSVSTMQSGPRILKAFYQALKEFNKQNFILVRKFHLNV